MPSVWVVVGGLSDTHARTHMHLTKQACISLVLSVQYSESVDQGERRKETQPDQSGTRDLQKEVHT